jgi:pimeloyl-ACP methyl ester carboxylesterase
VVVDGKAVVELSAGATTSPATVTARLRPSTTGGITDEVVVDLGALVPSDTAVSEVSVYFYPTSATQVAANVLQKTNLQTKNSVTAAGLPTPVYAFTFANSTTPYRLDQLNVVGKIGTIKLLASRFVYEPAKGLIKATFTAAGAAVSTVKAINSGFNELIVEAIVKNDDETTRLYHFPNLASLGAEVSAAAAVPATARAKIPLVLVHGIQLFTEGCGRNSAFKSTWDKFRTNFFSDAEISSKYELYSFSYPTNIDFKANGAAFSQKLSAVFGSKPVVVVAHSMGGLVTRAADVYYSAAAQSGNATDINIARVITLDTPHHGTPYINGAAGLSELLCMGVAQAAGGPSLAWDDLENNGSCISSGNPVLCELNSPQNLQHLKKYVPYSAHGILGAFVSYAGTNVAEYPWLLSSLTSAVHLLRLSFSQAVVDNYFSSEVAKKSDIAVLLPSQRLMSHVNNQWVDNPSLFADLPVAYPSTLHVDILDVGASNPGVAGSAKVWSKKADGTAGGVRGHLNGFASQLTGKPDLIPSAVTVTVTPAGVQPGGVVTVAWQMANSGNANAAASTTGLRLLSAATPGNGAAANQVLTVPTGALAAGGVANQSQALTIPAGTAPGSYVVVVVADNVATSTLGQSNVANDYARSSAFTVASAQASPTSVFMDNFDGTGLQSGVWTAVGAGDLVVSGGVVNLSCFANASTLGKLTFSGGRIVVEGGFTGAGQRRDTVMALTDVATGDRIQGGDTNYGNLVGLDGLYLYGLGAFGLPQFANSGTSRDTYMEYRLTVAGTQVTLERGNSLANLTEIVTGVLASSINGKTFYLNIGTGGPDFCPAVFDSVAVKTYQ